MIKFLGEFSFSVHDSVDLRYIDLKLAMNIFSMLYYVNTGIVSVDQAQL